MTDYITPDQLKEYIGSNTTNLDTTIARACTSASRKVEELCERTFTLDTAATARFYDPREWWCVDTNDISSTSGLIVATDDAADGTYSTAWTLNTDYFLEPVNQISGGITGFPYTRITTLRTKQFFKWTIQYHRPLVSVTAKWGWAAVPADVTEACLLIAARRISMKDTGGMGVQGLDGWGPVRVKDNPEIVDLLGPFMKNPVVVG